MKRTMLVGLVVGALAIAGMPFAAELAAAPGQPATEQPREQPETEAADTAALPAGELDLGTVRIPRAVRANGEPLAAGTYTVRLTPETADAGASPGATPEYERWVEFLRDGEVAGREMASLVPESQIDKVLQSGRPGADGSRVELLRGGDFLRVWIRRGNANVLIHLLAEGASS